jgi:hypothetical protein
LSTVNTPFGSQKHIFNVIIGLRYHIFNVILRGYDKNHEKHVPQQTHFSLLENQMDVLRTQAVGPDHYILAAMYQAANDASKLAKELWD